MLGILSVHQSLYNAALQERIEAYRKCGVSIGYKDQARSLTELRQTEKWISSVNAASQQVTLKRLQRAFENFFRRVKEGQTPGFPRFKSFKRYPGWGYKQHGDGFRFHRSHAKEEGAGSKHGTLFLSGVGKIKARGKMRVVGSIKCAEILHKRGQWSLSLTVEVPDVNRHQSGTKMGAGDWGVETLLTIVNADGSTQKIENPRHYQRSKESMIAAQQALSRKKRYSLRWKVCAKRFLNWRPSRPVREKILITRFLAKLLKTTRFSAWKRFP